MDPYNSADSLPPRQPPAQPPVLPPANPYAAPNAQVDGAADYEEYTSASRLARLGAALIDGAIISVPAILLSILMPVIGVGPDGEPSALGVAMTLLFAAGLIAFVAYQLILLYRDGQTVGKRIAGVRIVRADGSRAGLARILFLRAFVPGLVGAIPFVGWFFSLLDVLYIFGEEKRCLHDLIADTVVVNA